MSDTQIKHILRNAVIATLPVIFQTGCMTNAPHNPAKPPASDPCRGPVERSLNQSRGWHGEIPSIGSAPLSKEACANLCRSLIEKEYSSDPVNAWRGFVGLEDFSAPACSTKVNPHNKTYVACGASFTMLTTKDTGAPGCPAPPKPVPIGGRMPAGAHIQTQEANEIPSVLGAYFSDMAAMETAAVTAFRYLTRELEAYQAPDELIQMARLAVDEEIDHAEMAGLLSQAYRTPVPEIKVDDFQLRSLFEIALENAVEGCVNETFAAACGIWQHEHAEHEAFRAVMGRVAEEESGHADLSWKIHHWVMPQLSKVEQQHIYQAQQEAVAGLENSFKVENDQVLRLAVGLPDVADAARLIRELRGQLWNA